MQVFEKYHQVKHDEYKAITVNQPFADHLIDGMSGIIVSSYIHYRGTLVICSDQIPLSRYLKHYDRKRLSKVICMVNAHDCVKIKELSGKLWHKITGLSIHEKEFYRNMYILKVVFEKALFPMPIKPGKSIWNLIVQKRTLIAMEDVTIPKPKPIYNTSIHWKQIFIAIITISSLLYILTLISWL